MTINERIKFLLDLKKVGHEELAETLGVTKQAVGMRLNRDKQIDDPKFIDLVVEKTGLPKEAFLTDEGFILAVFEGFNLKPTLADNTFEIIGKNGMPFKVYEASEIYEEQIKKLNSKINDLQNNYAELKGESEELRRNNEWLKKMVEKYTGVGPKE